MHNDRKLKISAIPGLKSLALFIPAILSSGQAMAVAVDTSNCDKLISHFDRRVCEEKGMREKPFVLIPHRPSYLLGSWVDGLDQENPDYDTFETKFQLSFKVPLTKHYDDTKWLWFFGFTQVSVWQMLNFEHSAPFRDTNFEPELMLYRITNTEIFDWRMRLINFGLVNHQSNGQSVPKSRSWNRSYIELVFENGNNFVNFKTWHRWKEHQKDNPSDSLGDDNPDIGDYAGHGELRYLHVGRENNLGLTLRDTRGGDNPVSVQLDWTFPISNKEGLRFYMQYYNGYGETLIDYNIKRERFGMGVMLADWL